ncbi:MAG: hypothetical protein CMO34_05270 [Verrucomicrobia bacterium]|nr:hypothetical protein [Verrucomicrobiota bacterium]|tara:strand:- start:2173 stop:2898 length:726 start_codon:yes stop_codon:yes gene_type:complete
MKKIVFSSFILSACIFLMGASLHEKLDHRIWDMLLQEHVTNKGDVNYTAFKKDELQLEKYLLSLSDHPPKEDWSKHEKMAYWINAYNAFTVKLILDNYPLKSIMEINNGKAWDLKFIKIGGKEYSLNNIEHDILRANYKDARIHFAVNCASVSCPKLQNRAFIPERIEEQLEQASRYFINNTSKNNLQANQVKISRLFEWYMKDFTQEGSLVDFLNRYAAIKINSNAKVGYKEYDWNLNAQ